MDNNLNRDATHQDTEAQRQTEVDKRQAEDAKRQAEDAKRQAEDATRQEAEARRQTEVAKRLAEDAKRQTEVAKRQTEDAKRQAEDAKRKIKDALHRFLVNNRETATFIFNEGAMIDANVLEEIEIQWYWGEEVDDAIPIWAEELGKTILGWGSQFREAMSSMANRLGTMFVSVAPVNDDPSFHSPEPEDRPAKRPKLEDAPQTRAQDNETSSSTSESRIEPYKIVCVVCQEEQDKGSSLVSTVCGHIYCEPCFRLCRKHSKKCPMCSRYLSVGEFHPLYL